MNVVSKSGEQMPFGRWDLSAGGAFTKAGEEHTVEGVTTVTFAIELLGPCPIRIDH